ncbi:MAG: thermonuclease family protein [Planctomycetaceae bacterium]|jgi:micrococcal nuclease|nr:thermonuclease family protein [Planctomycetaceae bacterium]
MRPFRRNNSQSRLLVNIISGLLKLNRKQKTFLSAFILIAAFIGYVLFEQQGLGYRMPPPNSQQKSFLQEGIWQVSHVVDGDTIDVIDNRGQKYRIRLIGANTPETAKQNRPAEPYANKAMDFTKKIIAISKNQVRIKFDGDQIDKYGRNLAIVYVNTPKGEICLNEALIYEGLARARLQYNFSNAAKEKFKFAEQNAKNAKKNIWNMSN